jgi:hypothetical protein
MQAAYPRSVRYNNYLWRRRWGTVGYIGIPFRAQVIAGCFPVVGRPWNFKQRFLVLFVSRGKQLRVMGGWPAGVRGPTMPWARAGGALVTCSHSHIGASSHTVRAQGVRVGKQFAVLRHYVKQQSAFAFALHPRTFPPEQHYSVNTNIVLVTHDVAIRDCFTGVTFWVVTQLIREVGTNANEKHSGPFWGRRNRFIQTLATMCWNIPFKNLRSFLFTNSVYIYIYVIMYTFKEIYLTHKINTY